MKKLVLHISSEALSDLEAIWIYTSKKWSKEQADRYYSLLTDEMEFLQSNYYTGKSAEYILPGYRVSFVKSPKSRKKLPNGDVEIITEETGTDGNDNKPASFSAHLYLWENDLHQKKGRAV
jgi:toxin ParE1/3/4